MGGWTVNRMQREADMRIECDNECICIIIIKQMGNCRENHRTSISFDADCQSHLIKHMEAISDAKRKSKFEDQLTRIDFTRIQSTFLKAEEESLISSSSTTSERQSTQQFIPIEDSAILHRQQVEKLEGQFQSAGMEAISKGEVGVLILSGGENCIAPSVRHIATEDIGLDCAYSNFKVLIKRLLALEKLSGGTLRVPVYIMTSSENKNEIKNHFKASNYFDYGSNNIFFFSQPVGPVFNTNGQIALKGEGEILMMAQGNGAVYEEIINKKLLDHFNLKGIKYLFMGPSHNLLLKIADPLSLGFLITKNMNFVGTCFKFDASLHTKNGIGFYGYDTSGRPKIYEQVDSDQAKWANTGSCYLRVSFLKEVIQSPKKMQRIKEVWHPKFLQREILDLSYSLKLPTQRECLNFQIFYHDILMFAGKQQVGIMEIDEASEFAPMKAMKGHYSISSAVEKLWNNNKEWLKAGGVELEGSGHVQIESSASYFGKGILQFIKEKGFEGKVRLPVYIS